MEEKNGKSADNRGEVQGNVSGAIKKAASQISAVSKEAVSKLAPMASTARAAGKNAVYKAAGSAIVDKIAHNETVSKIVDSQVMTKVSKNKNKRVLIFGAVLIVLLVIIIGNLTSGGGDAGGSHDFSSKEKIEAYFRNQNPDARKITVGNNMSWTRRDFDNNLEKINGRQVQITTKDLDILYLFVTSNGSVYEYIAATTGPARQLR